MVYNEFLETMKKQMELALGDGYSLTLRKVQKNNSLILDGLCIEKDGSPVAPSIYLNPFYQHYLDGVSLETITKKLLTPYHENSYPPFLNQFALSDYASIFFPYCFPPDQCCFQPVSFKDHAPYSLAGSCYCLLSVYPGK